jgi:hypothetical protein
MYAVRNPEEVVALGQSLLQEAFLTPFASQRIRKALWIFKTKGRPQTGGCALASEGELESKLN